MKKLNKMLFATAFGILIGAQAISPVSANEINADNQVQEPQKEVQNESVLIRGKERGSYKYTLHRGSFLLWSDDIVYFDTRSGKMSYSSGDQDWGWIFPNYIEGKGIKKTSSSSSQHTYAGKKYVTAGIPTPWGAIGPYGTTVTDYIRVYGNSNATWW